MAERQTSELDLPAFFTPQTLADFVHVPVKSVYAWNQTPGAGPRGIRIGKHVRYAREDVLAWLAARPVTASARGVA